MADREHRKTILLTHEELESWTIKACAESISLSEFIRRRVREALSIQAKMIKLYGEHVKKLLEPES